MFLSPWKRTSTVNPPSATPIKSNAQRQGDIMRKLLIPLALVCLIALPVFAQENSKAEVFGGYQYTRINPGSGVSGENFNGWNAAFTANLNQWLGVTADVSGAYKDFSGVSAKQHNFLFGPTVSYSHSEKVKPFAHVLFGVSRADAGFSGISASENAFAMAFGGGADVAVNKNIAVRVGQLDYLLTRFGGDSQNNMRFSTGLVFRF
jgi:opacity protein-like surface antigen